MTKTNGNAELRIQKRFYRLTVDFHDDDDDDDGDNDDGDDDD